MAAQPRLPSTPNPTNTVALDLSKVPTVAPAVARPHITLYCYQLDAALDFEWETLFTLQELAKRSKSDNPHQFLKRLELLAMAVFTDMGMGGLRKGEGPGFFMVPLEESGFGYGFAAKEDNNGTTYIATPRELPWLAQASNEQRTVEIKAVQ